MVRYNASLCGIGRGKDGYSFANCCLKWGDGTVIRPPFHCDFGYNIRIGSKRVPQLQLRSFLTSFL